MPDLPNVAEYLALFTAYMARKQVPEEDWPYHLIAKMNERALTAISTLTMDQRDDMEILTDTLLNMDMTISRHASQTWFSLDKKEGQTLREVNHQLKKLVSRFAPGDDADYVRECFAMERLLQMLPKEARKEV